MPAEKKTEADKTPAVETLQKTLQEQQNELEKYKQLMQNPTMVSVLDKMAKGEEVILQDKTPEPEAKSMKEQLGLKNEPEKLDLDSLGNKELLGIVSESVETYVSQIKEETALEHQKELAAMKQELLKTQEAVLTASAQNQVKDLQTQHPDFETYREDMKELAAKYPTMSIDDLYKFAKGNHRLSVPGAQTTETEKPESSSPFPEWQEVHLRKPTGESEKSGGPSTTALRAPSSGRKDFGSLVNTAAQSFLQKQRIGG